VPKDEEFNKDRIPFFEKNYEILCKALSKVEENYFFEVVNLPELQELVLEALDTDCIAFRASR
jgi:hypothetical protein